MVATIKVRRARLSDADTIAEFVNSAQSGLPDQHEITRSDVAERFSQIGFVLAEQNGDMVGLLGWQIENLVVRVTDYLVAAADGDGLPVAKVLVEEMETEAAELRAETVLLLLPAHPSSGLVTFWEAMGYDTACFEELEKACREAVSEWGLEVERVMTKRLREDIFRQPM